MYSAFELTLMVNHACNLRCTYCYTGAKFNRPLSEDLGRKVIDRAVNSIADRGLLELGFFGGEPLLESRLIKGLIDYARRQTDTRRLGLKLSMTTNGTVSSPDSWEIMFMDEMELSVSCDGLPEIHDRFRRTAAGEGTFFMVKETLDRLNEAGVDYQVVTVVRPDTLPSLPESIRYLHSMGAGAIEVSLDLWTRWERDSLAELEAVIEECVSIWQSRLPDFRLNWFDEKAAFISQLEMPESPRCGFGAGQIAVSPAGNLYPCERLIGADLPDNPMRLHGDAVSGDHFLDFDNDHETTRDDECESCALESGCSTFCRCSNYVRTGDPTQPDLLLCILNQRCLEQTAAAFQPLVTVQTGKESS